MNAHSNRKKADSAGFGMAIGVLLLVGGLIAGVLYVSRLKHRAQAGRTPIAQSSGSEQAGTEPASTEPADSDPFGAEPANPTESRNPNPFEKRMIDPAVASSSDPFAALDGGPFADRKKSASTLKPDPGQLTGSRVWQEALEITSSVGGRLMLSTEAREKGNPGAERSYRREAIAKLDSALRKTQRWMTEEVSRFDPRDLQVRTVLRLRKRWTEQVTDLREKDAD